MSDSDKNNDFNDKIDAAIDNLFKPQQAVEIDPLTSEVVQKQDNKDAIKIKADPRKQNNPIISDEPKAKNKDADENTKESKLRDLLAKLDQSFLTIDWEITGTNTKNLQAILASVKQLSDPENTDLHSLFSSLNELVSKIATAPDKIPPYALKTLQKGIVLIKDAATKNAAAQNGLRKSVAELNLEIKELTSAISQPANNEPPEVQNQEFGADLMGADLPEAKISLELTNLVNLHLTILAQCINRILPLEKLFGQNDLYKKYLDAHQFIRQTLEEEKDRLATALNASLNDSQADLDKNHLPAGLSNALQSHIATLKKCRETILPIEELARQKGAKKLYRVEKEIRQQLEQQISPLNQALAGKYIAIGTQSVSDFPELFTTLKEHNDDLAKCIKQVIPLENLFGKTKGYEKLHAAQKRIRVQLEIQHKKLSTAMQSAQESTPATSVSINTTNQPSPWDTVCLANWNGQMVALLPNELGFEDSSGRAAKKLRPNQNMTLRLKKLKNWPWTKLAPMFKGDLMSVPESELNHLELPRLTPLMPATDDKDTRPQEETLIFLYSHGQGGAAIIEGSTRELTIADDWQWQPLINSQGFMLKGFLVKGEESLPVLSIA